MIVGVVPQSLLADRGRVQPVGEGEHERLAGLRRDDFVIADGEEERDVAEGLDLVPLRVDPGVGEVLGDGGVGIQLPVVLIEVANETQVAEVPVEARMAGLRADGDRGHHHIAAIARVARDHERPGRGARGCPRSRRNGGDQQYHGDTTADVHGGGSSWPAPPRSYLSVRTG